MKDLVKHKAFRVLLNCIMLHACVFGITYNCLGTFTVAICNDCGFSSGDFGMLTTMRTLINALFLLIIPRLLYSRWKNKLRYFIVGLGSLLFLSFGAGAFTNSVRVWHVIGALMGIGTGMFSLNQAYIIAKWFHKHTNLAIGISGAASGVVGMVFNPLASFLISSIGWRYSLLCFCALGLVMIWIAGFRIRYTPEETGLKPYGYGEEENKPASIPVRKAPSSVQYSPFILAFVLVLIQIVFIINNTLSVSVIYLPTYGTELGYGLTVASLFSSFVMVGNMGGKTIYGLLYDRYDWRVITIIVEAVILAGMLGLLLIRNSLPLILFCCVLVGTSQSSIIVLMNNIGRRMLGVDRYIGVFSFIQGLSSVAVSIFYAMAGNSYDATGSFRTCFIIVIAAYAVALVLLPVLFILRNRFGKVNDPDEIKA